MAATSCSPQSPSRCSSRGVADAPWVCARGSSGAQLECCRGRQRAAQPQAPGSLAPLALVCSPLAWLQRQGVSGSVLATSPPPTPGLLLASPNPDHSPPRCTADPGSRAPQTRRGSRRWSKRWVGGWVGAGGKAVCVASATSGARGGGRRASPASPSTLPAAPTHTPPRPPPVRQAALYGQLMGEVMARRAARRYDADSLALAARLLELNPEVYTAWNMRREALEAVLDGGGDAAVEATRVELVLGERALLRNPKSYAAWHHRKWVVRHGFCSLERELGLVGKLLDADERNFHAWAYRRFVVQVNAAGGGARATRHALVVGAGAAAQLPPTAPLPRVPPTTSSWACPSSASCATVSTRSTKTLATTLPGTTALRC